MEMAEPGVSLSDLLGRPMDGVSRLVVRHERRREFRWLVLLEIAVGLLLCFCLVPVLVVALLTGHDLDIDLPNLESRAFRHWHEIAVELVGADGRVAGRVTRRVRDAGAGDAMIASVLAAADRVGLVVVELLGGETMAVWYGGQPLLASPDGTNLPAAARALDAAGGGMRMEADRAEIWFPSPRVPRLAAALGLLALGAFAWVAPAGRAALAGWWEDLQGRPPGRFVFDVRADSLAAWKERSGRRTDLFFLRAADLVGLSWSASLGFAEPVTRLPPRLRIVGRDRAIALDHPREAAEGRALRDAIVGATAELRQRHPELGLVAVGEHPAHCPFCGALYRFGPGASCPSCGAPCSGLSP